MANLEVYFSTVPEENRYKLDQRVDSDHGGVPVDLGKIADSMDDGWEGSVAEHLHLSSGQIVEIKRNFPGDIKLQTRAALQMWQKMFGFKATYKALITAFVKAGRPEYADAVCNVLQVEENVNLDVYIASVPRKNRYKLDQGLDSDHGGLQVDLGTIADSMSKWEGSVAEQLGLTIPETEIIKKKLPRIQTRAVLQKWQEKFGSKATYKALITAFVKAGRPDYADAVCNVLQVEESGTSQNLTPPTSANVQVEEVQHDYQPGIWRQGILIAASNKELTTSPMKLLKKVSSLQTNVSYTISLCKQHLLGTYRFHNEYSSPTPDVGCELNAMNQSKCKFPAVVMVSVSDTQRIPERLDEADLNVDTVAGLPERVTPDVLFASQFFLESYGFNKKEVVWYRHITPLPLERVMLTACDDPTVTDSERVLSICPGKVVSQIYEKSRKECVTVQQDFNFAMKVQVTLPRKQAESLSHFEMDELSHTLPDDGNESSHTLADGANVSKTGEVNFKILECSPVLQGRITEQTTIAVLPPNEVEEEEVEENFDDMNEEVERPIELSGESSYADDSMLTFRGRSGSNASASDFKNEDIKYDMESIKATGTRSNEYIIEAVPVREFKLQSHYIVLPKQSAEPHGIFGCQQVWVSSTTMELLGSPRKKRTALRDLIVPVANPDIKERYTADETGQQQKHLAMVFLYEDGFQLEKHVPLPSLRNEYSSEDLTRAYIHPELLFYLYPETLSPSRRYYLHVERIHTKEVIPPLTKLFLSEVYQPGTQMEAGEKAVSSQSTTKPLRSFFMYRTMYVHKSGVFGIKIDEGKSVYYKVHSFEPDTHVAIIDTTGAWELSVKPKVKSFLPDIVPPCPHQWTPVPYFEDIRPPGLEDYCDKLFSLFVPALTKKSSTQPHRSPSVLFYGPPGVGKRTVVKAVAKKCRMHVVEVNCFEFCTEVVGFAEKKMTVDLDSASMNSPVMIILRQVQMMGKKSPIKEEPRYMAIFEHYMNEMNKYNRTSPFPVLVVGVTSELNSVPARIQACFLHQLEMTSPSEDQRQAMLSALSLEYSIAPEIDLVHVAKQTAGFVMGDFVTLFTNAFDKAFEDATKYSMSSLGHIFPEDLAVSGIVLAESHIEKALADLHASHSDAIGAPKIPNVKWDDVGGLAEAKREILDTIQLPLLHPELFPPGLRRSGVLLYGAPGTGKTLLAKAVATECSMNFLSVKGPELINSYVGQSEENIREVFTRARSTAPCIVFFDELDSIAPNRGRSGDSGGVMDRVVSQLLAELDGLQRSENVFVIGATNRPDLIDPGLLRPGRFDRLVYLDVSEDVESKVKILRAITRKFNKANDVDLTLLAEKCPLHLTGADLYALCSDAMLTALRKKITELEKQDKSDEEFEGQLTVCQQDFLDSLSTLTPSVSVEELKRYDDIRKTMIT